MGTNERGKKILILGECRSGTTALCFAVHRAMPRRSRVLFEPLRYVPEKNDEKYGVLAKVVLQSGLDLSSFACFDRKVLISRDPRDRTISDLLYRSYEFYNDRALLESLMNLLTRKESHPLSLPMRELFLTYIAPHQISKRFQERMQGFFETENLLKPFFQMKYEDFVEQHVRGLEAFLGFPIDSKIDVPASVQRVSRSKAHGAWRDWFTPEDEAFFKPLFAQYMERYGYPADWTLNSKPSISPEHSSEYVLRIVNERRIEMGLKPVRGIRGHSPDSRLHLITEDEVHGFDWKFYVSKYLDLQRAGIDTKEKAETHYLEFGKNEGREPHPQAFEYSLPFYKKASRFFRNVEKAYRLRSRKTAAKTFKHNGSLGDIIYALPTIRALGGGVLYVGDGSGDSGLGSGIFWPPPHMTKKSMEELAELLRTQPFLAGVRAYQQEEVDYNLDQFREERCETQHLARAHLRACSVQFDLGKAWLQNIRPQFVKEIIIHRTNRYISYDRTLDWGLFKQYEKQCAFIGYEKEYLEFKKDTGLSVERYEVRSILEMAQVIRGSKLFVGNQSLGFALAEGMKQPRVLEFFPYMPNCMPQSLNGYICPTPALLERILTAKDISLGPLRGQNLLANMRNHIIFSRFKKRLK